MTTWIVFAKGSCFAILFQNNGVAKVLFLKRANLCFAAVRLEVNKTGFSALEYASEFLMKLIANFQSA